MTILLDGEPYELSETLMPCRCKRGDLVWNAQRRAWCCDSTYRWIDGWKQERHCEAGLAFSALFDRSDGMTARPSPIEALPMTYYGLILVIRGTITLSHITAHEARRRMGFPQRLLPKIEGFEKGPAYQPRKPTS